MADEPKTIRVICAAGHVSEVPEGTSWPAVCACGMNSAPRGWWRETTGIVPLRSRTEVQAH